MTWLGLALYLAGLWFDTWWLAVAGAVLFGTAVTVKLRACP